MRLILTILIFCFLIFSCNENRKETNWTTKIEDKLKDLKKTKEVKFGGGDVWGTKYIYSNNDSSIMKIKVDYDAGDYGKGQNEFLLVNSHLVYQRDYVFDWLIIKSPQDSNNYKLRETVSYFKPDSTGIKQSKAVYSKSLEFNNAKIQELRNKGSDTETLNKTDYVRQYEELKQTLEFELIED